MCSPHPRPGLAPRGPPSASRPSPSPTGFVISLFPLVPQTSVPLGTHVFLEGAIQFGATEALVGFSPRVSTLCPAKCAQLLVSIKQRRPEDQDAEGFQKVLHFGSVAVGCTAERQIKLYNPSAVCVLCPWREVGAGLRDHSPGCA